MGRRRESNAHRHGHAYLLHDLVCEAGLGYLGELERLAQLIDKLQRGGGVLRVLGLQRFLCQLEGRLYHALQLR